MVDPETFWAEASAAIVANPDGESFRVMVTSERFSTQPRGNKDYAPAVFAVDLNSAGGNTHSLRGTTKGTG